MLDLGFTAIRMTRLAAGALAWATACGMLAGPAHAQTFPSRQITIISPSQGRIGDAPVRYFAPGLAENLGQPVIVENRPGAASNLGHAAGARAAPDGYTLTFVSQAMVMNPYLYKSAGYALRDFAPITQLTAQDNAIAVTNSLPVNNLNELIAHLKANPGKLSFADQGGHQLLDMSALFSAMGIRLLMVPYNSPPMNDLVMGNVHITANSPTLTLPLHKAGKVRIVGWTGTKRRADFPDMQIGAELLPGWSHQSWNGLVAPAGTPREHLDRIHQAVAAFLKKPETQAWLEKTALHGVGSTPDEYAAFLKESDARMSKAIKELGLLNKLDS